MRRAGDLDGTDRPIDERMGDLVLIGDALARAVTEALKRHKLAGNPVAEWRDGRVRWVQPSEIPVA